MTGLRHSSLLFGLLLAIFPLTAQEQEESGAASIIQKSPFLPPNFQPPGGTNATAAPPAQASQYEYRGVYQLDGQYYFNLYNTRERKGSWVSKAQSGDGTPKIIEFDLENDVLVVDAAGQQLSLNMVKTSDNPLPLSVNRPETQPTPTTLPATPSRTQPQRTTPARRRVIRPTTRPGTSSSEARRRIIRPTSRNSNS